MGYKFDYAIRILERNLREVCSPVVVSVYPNLTENGKRAFKRNFKNQVKDLKAAIKILKENNNEQ